MWNSSKACHYSHAWSVWVCCPALSLEAFQPWVLRGELLCLMWSGRSEGVKMARGGQGSAWNVVTSPWQWILRRTLTEALGVSPLETLNYRNFLGLHYKLPLWDSGLGLGSFKCLIDSGMEILVSSRTGLFSTATPGDTAFRYGVKGLHFGLKAEKWLVWLHWREGQRDPANHPPPFFLEPFLL